MDKTSKKNNSYATKNSEKNMSRTEFANEYSLDTTSSNMKKTNKSSKKLSDSKSNKNC